MAEKAPIDGIQINDLNKNTKKKKKINKDTFLVHALSKELAEDLQSGEMDKLITGLHKCSISKFLKTPS